MTNTLRTAVDNDLPFLLRGATFTMMVLKVLDPADPSFFPQLSGKLRQAPNFFHNAPIVLDLEDLATEFGVPELAAMVARLRQCNLFPVGIVGGTPNTQKAAMAIGLPVMPAGRAAKAEPAAAAPATVTALPQASLEPVRESAYQKATLVITEPVRSGQQVYAARGDLIVLAPVSAGAELLADGNIHIYDTLRGRALAGLGGDTSARIFCQSLDAEMVSIAGLYRVHDDMDKAHLKKSVQIFLKDGYLHMEPLS